jgi:SAM-dependent methyltransferase
VLHQRNLFNKLDLWLDIRNGLPFSSNSVDSIYSTHVFEHCYPDGSNLLLQQYLRVLKPRGRVWLIVPNLESPVEAYKRNQSSRFDDSFPRHFDSLEVDSPISSFAMYSTAVPSTLLISTKLVRKAEFQEVERAAESKSRLYKNWDPPYEPGDSPDLPRSLYVEAFK